jgi:predicted ATPase/DNA-binding winged helix-turn-helix (wHTH) protein
MAAMDHTPDPPTRLVFGRFQVLPHRRELLADGHPLKLGGRAFDVLMVLLEACGAVVSRDTLMDRAWPDRIVEENALPVQISALRAALGADRDLILTVPGRGYQFTGEIQLVPAGFDETAGEPAATPGAAAPPTNVPTQVSELIGRDDELGEILRLAAAHRLITLTGPGGIGKTRLALSVARRLLPNFADGVWVAEFSPLTDPGLVPATVAGVIGLQPGGGTASPQLVAQALADKRLLLVLDTCEHVVGAASALAEAVLQASPAVRIIATSREALRAEGEWIYPVRPLAVPPPGAGEQDDPLRYGAVKLFIDRVRASASRFAPDRHHAAIIAAICRRLDGIPLAIELAAARAATLGVDDLATRLDDRFRLLTSGRRTALPRHQTLRATLDWSYGLLPVPERVVLRRLAIFAGAFSLTSASMVVASADLTSSEVVEATANLVAKSLVSTNFDATITPYRLLDTTRAYALERLAESGEREQFARRHAEYLRDLFERAEAEWERRSNADWLADYSPRIDNLRAALDWAFSPAGDRSVGVALAAAAVPLWMQLSLLEECRGRVGQALAALNAGPERDARSEMKLHAALGAALMYTRGVRPEIGPAWTKALEIAERLDDTRYRLWALWGLWSFNVNSGQYRAALELAGRFRSLSAARPDPNDQLVGERMLGLSQHLLGDQSTARRHFERVIADYPTLDRQSHTIRFQIDLLASTRVFLAWILWLQGFPGQAMREVESCIADARATNHALSLCYAVGRAACPLALLVGDLDTAEQYLAMLHDHATRHALPLWRAIDRFLQGVLAVKRGDVATGVRLLRAGLDELHEARTVVLRFLALLMAEALSQAGQAIDGLAAVEEALTWTEDSEERWAMAELLRIKGELLLSQDPQGTAPAEALFRQALDWAHRQGALSWELRAAVSLARLLRDQHRTADALGLLQPVYDRFAEGFGTADLKAAKSLLEALR